MRRLPSFLTVCFLVLGCESHPDVVFDVGATPTPAFEMTFISPDDASMGVDRASPVLAAFSSPVDSSTVSAATFIVSTGSIAVAGSLSVEGSTVLFTPDDDFPPLSNFGVTIAATVSGLSGAGLSAQAASSFQTRDVKWDPPANIENISGASDSAQVGVDSAGDALVVFRQAEGAASNIRAVAYDRDSGTWSASILIESDAGAADTPSIAVDPSGDAVAVWRQNDGTRMSLYGARYVKGSGWGTRTLLESDNNGDVLQIATGVADDGEAFVVWSQFDGTRYDTWAKRYLPGIGWQVEQRIETSTDNVDSIALAVGADGSAVVAWIGVDATPRFNVWANEFSPGGAGWGIAEVIEAHVADASSLDVAIDGSGNAFALWKACGTPCDVWSNRTVGGVWGAAAALESSSLNPGSFVSIAASPSGTAVACWTMSDGTDRMWASIYSSGWSTAGEIGSEAVYTGPELVMDSDGRLTAFFIALDPLDSTPSIWTRRLVDGTWMPASPLETSNAGGFGLPQAKTSATGDVIAVWKSAVGSNALLWASATR